MRPTTPLAVENSVGKPAAYKAPNAGAGKRAFAAGMSRVAASAIKNFLGVGDIKNDTAGI
jgi:hypothetical protein